ncbi:hypothetical protein BD626DRAFT_576396 [Schizophyllum amplum]|uniref:F-box domain-containing protein n=1 Tax=Schizophyllum amplum TaxID=97359 RepID=A0A550BTQ3_9AGAR|nr:hypothetical protein BD626DRAFT_576396 [Auriculariopsis ampla]
MASGHFGLLPELAPEVFFYSDRHTMSAWSLVARYFTPLAQPVLYSTFILGGYKLEHPALPESGYIVNVDHDHFVRGARHLSDHPHLRSYVRRLVLGVCVADGAQSYDADGSQSYDEDGVLVRHAGGLDAGAIDNLTSTLLLQGYLPNLTDLHLHPCNPPQDRRPPFLRCPPFLMPYHMNDMFRSRITSSTISRLVFHNFEIGGWKAGHILELLVTGDVHDVALNPTSFEKFDIRSHLDVDFVRSCSVIAESIRYLRISTNDSIRMLPVMPNVRTLIWVWEQADVTQRACTADLALVLRNLTSLEVLDLRVDVALTMTIHQALASSSPRLKCLCIGFPSSPPMEIIGEHWPSMPSLTDLVLHEGQPFDIGAFVAYSVAPGAPNLTTISFPPNVTWDQFCVALSSVAASVKHIQLLRFCGIGPYDTRVGFTLPRLRAITLDLTHGPRNDLGEIWNQMADFVVRFLPWRQSLTTCTVKIIVLAEDLIRMYEFGDYSWSIFTERQGDTLSKEWHEWLASLMDDLGPSVRLNLNVRTPRYTTNPDMEALSIAKRVAVEYMGTRRFSVTDMPARQPCTST